MTRTVGERTRTTGNTTARTDTAATPGNTTVQDTTATQQPANVGWQQGAGRTRTTGVQDVHRVTEQPLVRPQRLTGHMEMSDDGSQWRMRLANGQSVDLANSAVGMRLQNSNQPMNPMYAKGFVNDGIQMTVRGQLGADGKFQVEDFSPGTSDKYVSGRVQMRLNGETIPRGDPRAAQATVFVNTTRGDVEIKDPNLAEKFRLAGPLGVILPGDPKMVNGKMVYESAPSAYFALGRPQAMNGASAPAAVPNPDGTFMTQHAMAYHGFNGPTLVPDQNAAGRTNHMDRNWLLGDFTLGTGDKAGQLTDFRATYVSGPAGSGNITASGEPLPDARNITDPAQLQAAHQQIVEARRANPNLAIVEQQVTNMSHTSPPVDLGAYSMRTPPPRTPTPQQ